MRVGAPADLKISFRVRVKSLRKSLNLRTRTTSRCRMFSGSLWLAMVWGTFQSPTSSLVTLAKTRDHSHKSVSLP